MIRTSISTSVSHRLGQGLDGLRPAHVPPACAELLDSLLSTSQRAEFRKLGSFDQAHLCDVALRVRRAGVTDPDVLTAAILHDIGKADSRGRVSLPDRIARVLLRSAAPRLLHHLAAMPGPRWRHGLALCVHHPRLGADLARRLGSTDRTCWLIAHHEDDPAPDDRDLGLLMAADRGDVLEHLR